MYTSKPTQSVKKNYLLDDIDDIIRLYPPTKLNMSNVWFVSCDGFPSTSDSSRQKYSFGRLIFRNDYFTASFSAHIIIQQYFWKFLIHTRHKQYSSVGFALNYHAGGPFPISFIQVRLLNCKVYRRIMHTQ